MNFSVNFLCKKIKKSETGVEIWLDIPPPFFFLLFFCCFLLPKKNTKKTKKPTLELCSYERISNYYEYFSWTNDDK